MACLLRLELYAGCEEIKVNIHDICFCVWGYMPVGGRATSLRSLAYSRGIDMRETSVGADQNYHGQSRK